MVEALRLSGLVHVSRSPRLWYASGIPLVCLWYASGMPLVCLWYASGTTKAMTLVSSQLLIGYDMICNQLVRRVLLLLLMTNMTNMIRMKRMTKNGDGMKRSDRNVEQICRFVNN